MEKQKQINIPYRDIKIQYMVDGWSCSKMSEHWGCDFDDMKHVLRSYGFVVRNETRPPNPPKNYTIVLVDTDKIVKKEEVVSKNSVVVS